jgi:hypothetical protein
MKIGFIKDVFSGMPHVVASMENEVIHVKSITEFGKSIIEDFDFDKKDIGATVPVGCVFTGFFADNNTLQVLQKETRVKQENFAYVGKSIKGTSRRKINAIGLEMNKFTNGINKINVIAFKAESFKNSVRRSTFIRRIHSGKIIFNEKMGRIELNPKFAFSGIEKEILNSSFGKSFIRKSADKQIMQSSDKRRVARRAKVLLELSGGERSHEKQQISERIDKARRQVKNGK